MMPLGCEGDCQMSRTEVVRTSGNRMPTGGPGTAGKQKTSYIYIFKKKNKKKHNMTALSFSAPFFFYVISQEK